MHTNREHGAATLALVLSIMMPWSMVPAVATGAIIHVDAGATGASNGNSWNDAFTDLQHALAIASAGDQIRVAEGSYRPHTDDRTVSFVLVEGVRLTGGYAPGGVAGPDPTLYPTILSGDLAADDLPGGTNSGDNSERVVTAFDINLATVVDGFTITAANGEGGVALGDFVGGVQFVNTDIVANTGHGISAPNLAGFRLIGTTVADNTDCGIFLRDGAAVVIRSRLMRNQTGICSADAGVTVVGSVISGNATAADGGGIWNGPFGTVDLINSLVTGNHAGGFGGGIYNAERVSIVNSVVAGNSASLGGGIYNGIVADMFRGSVQVANSIVWDNTPQGAGIVEIPVPSLSTVEYSDVAGWTGGGAGNIDTDPMFAGQGDYRLQPSSPAIDAGDDSHVPADTFDVDGDGNLTEPTPDLDLNDRIAGAAVDMGAYELSMNSPPIADANGPYIAAAGTVLFVDASGSSDPDDDALRYDWDWGDGTSSADAGPMPNHVYDLANIYRVCVTVSDPAGATNTDCTEAVIYDPTAGKVIGGGWFDSPRGAYRPDPGATGRMHFGFVSLYRRGADIPTGVMRLRLVAAGINFLSTGYDWLVLPGDRTAVFTGSGTINGSGDYRFRVWIVDGAPDAMRIRIWTSDTRGTETVVYDTGSAQTIGGGNIVVHDR